MKQNREKVCVLLSCMHQNDRSIVETSNIQTDCVVINQCDINKVEEYDFINKKGESCHVKFVSTIERGLSKSRNMAIVNSTGDICLICDDDEVLEDDYELTILKGYQETQANVVIFTVRRNDGYRQFSLSESRKMSLREIFKTSSQQLTFRNNPHIRFDEKMGSGTGNGGGEEIKFLMDMKRFGNEIFYYPALIASVNPGESQWFYGCDEKFLRDKGWAIRRTVGAVLGMMYNIYFSISHRKEFMPHISLAGAFREMCIGWRENR